MGKKKSVPGIRLSQFDNEWIEHAVGELLTERVDLSPKSNEYPLMAFVANQGIVPKGERYDRSALVTDTENKLYKKTELGDFIYSSNNLESGSIGLNNYGKATISPVYSIFAPTELGVSSFLGRRLVRSDFIKEMVKWRQGVIYGQWRIHEADFEKITVRVPNVDEQIEIGGFLLQIDNLILSGQKKLEKLQNLKLSMLEKMFPKDGAVVPEVRFKGFAGVWDRKPAVELFTAYVDKGHPELPVLSATQDAGMVIRDALGKSVFHEVANEVGYKRVLPGQFVIHLRSFQGGFAHSAIEGITSPAYTVFGFKEPEKHDDYFWKYIFMSKQFIKRLETVTYGIRDGRSISYDEFLTLDFLFPQKEEQSLICQYLLKLDSLIAMRKQELDKLQSLKKALLEKMFV